MSTDDEFTARLRARVERIAPDLAVDTTRVIPGARRRRAAVWATGGLALVLATGGVSWAAASLDTTPPPPVAPATGTATEPTAVPTTPPTPEPTTAEEPAVAVGPLEAFMDQAHGLLDQTRDEVRQSAVIATCMADHGFEYSTERAPRVDVPEGPAHGGPAWGSLEWIRTYGYGRTTTTFDDYVGGTMPDPAWVDPNEAYVATLSEEQRAAYHQALDGGDPGSGGAPGSCMRTAWEQEPYTFEIVQEAFPRLSSELDQVGSMGAGDPRLDQLEADWLACMAGAGYEGMTSMLHAEDVVIDLVRAASLPAGTALDRTDTDQWYLSGTLQDQWWPTVESLVGQGIDAAREHELAIAADDVACREAVDAEEIRRTVSWEAQQAYLDAHREELEAWLALANSRP